MQAMINSLRRGVCTIAVLLHMVCGHGQSGALDPSFNPGTGANQTISQTIALPNGSFLIAGTFSSYNGTACGRIARILPDGSYDATFFSGTGFNGQVDRIAVRSDGMIIALGLFSTYNGNNVDRVALLFPDGTLDLSFTPIAPNPGTVTGLEVLPDDRFIITGIFVVPGHPGQVRAVRFMPDGSLDQVLATMSNVNSVIVSVLTLPDGRIAIAGGFTTVQGQSRHGIALLTSNGVLDPTFDPGTGIDVSLFPVQRLALSSSGKLYVMGKFTQYNGTSLSNLVRLETSGMIDPTWNTTNIFSDFVTTVVELAGDKILCGGHFIQVNGVTKRSLCALSMNGDLIPEFPRSSGAAGGILNIHPNPAGNVVITGAFVGYDGVTKNRIARLINCPTDEWYPDADGDGAGAMGNPLITCTPPAGHVSNATDCDDGDPLITTGGTWFADADGDGAGDVAVQQVACTIPNGYVGNSDDCNDADPQVIGPVLWYMDQDGDGHGNVMAPTQLACTAPPGHVSNNTDCNDFDPTAHELSIWYADTDGDGFGDVNALLLACSRPSGHVSNSTDCDDSDPMATVVRNWYADTDGDGYGDPAAPLTSCSQPPGHVLDGTDCDDSTPTLGGHRTWYLDGDNDDFGLTDQSVVGCSEPMGYSAGSGDCDDLDPLIYPDAPCNDGNGNTHFDRIRPDCTCAGRGVQVSPIVYLDVPLNAQGWMDATLLANDLLPIVEPYTALGYSGLANGAGGNTTTPQMLDPDPLHPELQAVDWVVVELRPSSSPGTVVAAQACLLRRNGLIHRPDVMAVPEFFVEQAQYFVSVRHRNHLGIMSSTAYWMDQPTSLLLNFAGGTTPVTGQADAMKPNGNKLALWPGDVWFNGNVQYAGLNNDRDPILLRIGGTVPTNTAQGYFSEDVNLDGVVKYAGTNNDRDKVLQTIGGTVPTNIRYDHLPN